MSPEYYRLRFEAIRDAASRARWAFAAIIFGSVIQLSVVYNAYFSWDGGFALKKPPPDMPGILVSKLLDNWIASSYASIPGIGVKISAHDVDLLGAIALLLISTWFFFCSRRENHLIGQTLAAAKHDAETTSAFELAFYAIAGTQVFAVVRRDDNPIDDYDAPPQQLRPLVGTRFVIRLLYYTPFAAAALTLAGDIWSLATPSPFRPGDRPLIQQILEQGAYWSLGRAALTIIVCTFLAAFTLMINDRTAAYQLANTKILRKASRYVVDPLTPVVNSPEPIAQASPEESPHAATSSLAAGSVSVPSIDSSRQT